RRRHTRFSRDWSSDVCSSDLRYGWRREPPPGETPIQPIQIVEGLFDGRAVPGHRTMARHQCFKLQGTQLSELLPPDANPRGMRCGRCPAAEYQITGEQHPGGGIEYHQVGAGMAAESKQWQRIIAKADLALLYGLGWQYRFGAAHGVSQPLIKRGAKAVGVPLQGGAGGRQRGNFRAIEGLVAEHMIRVMMGVDNPAHRLVGDGGDGRPQ